jgi:hypothetical protein
VLSLENIEELETEVAEDKNRYSASLCMEEETIKTIFRPGFGAVHRRVRLLWEQQAIAERIRKNKIMLVWARNQS